MSVIRRGRKKKGLSLMVNGEKKWPVLAGNGRKKCLVLMIVFPYDQESVGEQMPQWQESRSTNVQRVEERVDLGAL